ncbi:YeiH family putative sulfate export transporter [Bacillus sp. Xin]|uniref:YeiH family protein n=1 Tax=unclassified Bacillus (in: firmicutes) TaxID=185979 RepID=UPI001573631F|nr:MULTISPECIES: YeiH family protein [unclassified Bacillus (in: firmicutes)]MBC6975205.1 YeiH family putative sulfate export transporter [Bacillus sp. Xin]NSW36789.1 YeiH family putative sulfate export transporter [Bacillus sp. Xin1]
MEQTLVIQKKKRLGFSQGIGITLLIAIAAKYLATLPFLNIMGQLVIAILIGMIWRATISVPYEAIAGTNFASKKLLRFGIILLGMRLNLVDIAKAGPKVLVIAAVVIAFTLVVVYALTRFFKVDKKLGILTACGTAICGAAAVVAIAPQVKAKDDETAVGAAIIAILGTIFTLIYTLLYPVLGLSPYGYGVFSGATLHEIAHVIAAAAPGGSASVDIAVIVKLTRVTMLVPVAILIGLWFKRNEGNGQKSSWRDIPIPWFILGFLAMSAVHSLGIVPENIAGSIVTVAYMLIAMAMAGLGLNVEFTTFRKLGSKAFVAGLVGSVCLSALGYILVYALGFM